MTRNIPVGMRFQGALSLLAVLAVAACGGGETKTVTVRETVTQTSSSSVPEQSPELAILYFLRDGKVAPVPRSVVAGPHPEEAALDELLQGPTSDENDLETAIPAGITSVNVTVEGSGVVDVGLSKPVDKTAQAQIVYTLTALPNVNRVSFGGASPVGRKAFEAQTPAILVESPWPGESVEPGFRVTGTANTFEATFNYELKDASGKVLSKDFVTATSGSGTRGTFTFTVPYEVDKPQEGKLLVFEISAEDGSRTHESELPLQLE